MGNTRNSNGNTFGIQRECHGNQMRIQSETSGEPKGIHRESQGNLLGKQTGALRNPMAAGPTRRLTITSLQSALAPQHRHPVLTESIFPGLISRRRNYSVKMRMHKRSHHPKLHTNSLPVPTHSHHPKRHTSSLPVPSHFGAVRTPPRRLLHAAVPGMHSRRKRSG